MSDFPFTTIKMAGLERKPDGTIKINGLEMDPDKLDAEKVLYNHIMQQISAMPMPTAPFVQPAAVTSTGLLLSEASEKFIEEKRALDPKSLYYKNDVPDDTNLLIRIIGDIPVADVNRGIAVNFFNTLKKLPPNLNKSPLFRGKSIDQILKIKSVPRSASTVNGVMITCSALFEWLKLYEHVKQDFFTKLRMPRKKGGRDRFDDSDLNRIFTDKIFTDHEYEYAYRYWIPLISLHSGMRMNEICQLRPQDIRDDNGILMMHVAEDNEEMSVKTESSIRRVPVHQTLIDLGFDGFLYSRRKEEWVFDGLEIAEDGRRSKKASHWMCKTFRPRVGLKIKGEDFHSFRHTVIDDLKQQLVNVHVLKAVVGHSDQLPEVAGDDITIDRYGKQYYAQALYDMVDKLNYTRVLGNVKKWC